MTKASLLARKGDGRALVAAIAFCVDKAVFKHAAFQKIISAFFNEIRQPLAIIEFTTHRADDRPLLFEGFVKNALFRRSSGVNGGKCHGDALPMAKCVPSVELSADVWVLPRLGVTILRCSGAGADDCAGTCA